MGNRVGLVGLGGRVGLRVGREGLPVVGRGVNGIGEAVVVDVVGATVVVVVVVVVLFVVMGGLIGGGVTVTDVLLK